MIHERPVACAGAPLEELQLAREVRTLKNVDAPPG
jgi:hypothetical protein